MGIEQRRAGIQAIEPHMLRIHRELLDEPLSAPIVHSVDRSAGREDQINGPRVFVDVPDRGADAQRREIDSLRGHDK